MSSSNSIEIDEYSLQYQDSILNLILEIQQKEFGIAIEAKDQMDLTDIKKFYQVKKGNFWVALFNGKVVGTISLLDIGNEQAALRKMFATQSFRGEQYQTALMLLNTLLRWARTKGLKEIYLGTTPKFIAAHRFYGKNGFVEISKDLLPNTFPIMKVDTKFYKFEL